MRGRTCRLLVARTSFLLVLLVLGAGHASFAPSLKNSGLARAPARAKRSGMRPMTYPTQDIVQCQYLCARSGKRVGEECREGVVEGVVEREGGGR